MGKSQNPQPIIKRRQLVILNPNHTFHGLKEPKATPNTTSNTTLPAVAGIKKKKKTVKYFLLLDITFSKLMLRV